MSCNSQKKKKKKKKVRSARSPIHNIEEIKVGRETGREASRLTSKDLIFSSKTQTHLNSDKICNFFFLTNYAT